MIRDARNLQQQRRNSQAPEFAHGNARRRAIKRWKHLRGEALGVKFRRQVSIGRTVVDLGCPSLHLAIEVDGASHASEDARAYEEARQREIESLGARFIRVANEDVYRCALDVADGIALVVAEMKLESDEVKAEE